MTKKQFTNLPKKRFYKLTKARGQWTLFVESPNNTLASMYESHSFNDLVNVMNYLEEN